MLKLPRRYRSKYTSSLASGARGREAVRLRMPCREDSSVVRHADWRLSGAERQAANAQLHESVGSWPMKEGVNGCRKAILYAVAFRDNTLAKEQYKRRRY